MKKHRTTGAFDLPPFIGPPISPSRTPVIRSSEKENGAQDSLDAVFAPLENRRGLMQLLVAHYLKKARVSEWTMLEPLQRRSGASSCASSRAGAPLTKLDRCWGRPLRGRLDQVSKGVLSVAGQAFLAEFRGWCGSGWSLSL